MWFSRGKEGGVENTIAGEHISEVSVSREVSRVEATDLYGRLW